MVKSVRLMFAQRMALAMVLTALLIGCRAFAQEFGTWPNISTPEHSISPEAIIVQERATEDARRAEAREYLLQQFERVAVAWRETQRIQDERLRYTLEVADQNARQAARWQWCMQGLQLVGAALNLAHTLRDPIMMGIEDRKPSLDDLEGEEITLCEENDCVGISLTEVLEVIEAAGATTPDGTALFGPLSDLREGLSSMGPIRCQVEVGECDAGEGFTREPAWLIPTVHALRTVAMRLQAAFPRAGPRLHAFGRSAGRFIQRSGAHSKQITKKWGQHATEFRKDGLATTREGYRILAEHYMKRPHGTYWINHPSGRRLIYDRNTNVFTVVEGRKFITMFRPGETTKYWFRNADKAVRIGGRADGTSNMILWGTLPEAFRHKLNGLTYSE